MTDVPTPPSDAPGSGRAIFLSYASEDAPAAEALATALRARGLEVWLDKTELRGGDAWDQAIRRQIKACALFVPLISARTRARAEGYFRLEWKLAVDRSHLMAHDRPFLVPVVIDDTRDDDARVPDRFAEIQWTRLPGGRATPEFVARMARLLEPEATEAPRAPAAAAPAAGRRRGLRAWLARRRDRPRSPLRYVVMLAAIAFAWWSAWNDSDEPSKTPAPAPAAAATVPATTAPPAPVAEHSVAVLPFADLSAEHDQGYFADGLAEELIDRLAQVPGLTVTSRTSAFYFKGRADDLPTIAARLHVAHVLEGSVRRSGNRVRVSAQLVRADRDRPLWSKTYDRDVRDLLKVQDEIAAAVVAALKLHLLDGVSNVAYRPTNPEAYELFLRARESTSHGDGHDDEDTLLALRRATELEPGFGPALALLAQTEYQRGRDLNDDALIAQAFRDVDHAIELAPGYAEGYQARAFLRGAHRLDLDGALSDLERAVSLDPASSIVHESYANALAARGRLREAIGEAERALTNDPLAHFAWGNLGRYRLALGETAAAREAVQRSHDLAPAADYVADVIPESYLLEGDAAHALAAAGAIHDPVDRLGMEAVALGALGRKAEAQARLAALVARARPGEEYRVACTYAALGDRERGFEWLRRARAAHADLRSITYEPLLRGLRADPRYAALAREWKLAT